jgi:hypothetical protein
LTATIKARNILIFTLITAGTSPDKIFNIFYHIFLDDPCDALLTQQSRTLAEAAESYESWNKSDYGSWLQCSSSRTLAELRRHWNLYARFQEIPRSRVNELRQNFAAIGQKALKKSAVNLSVARCGGPVWADAVKPGSVIFRRFWETGTTFLSAKDVRTAKNVNASFVYSLMGEKLEPHYGTAPVQGFHLAEALAPLEQQKYSEKVTAEQRIVSSMRGQFDTWCNAFADVFKAGNITLRFHVGDALAFCRALAYFKETGEVSAPVFAAQWQTAAVSIDAYSATCSPTSFNIIDTSNLMDHVGLLNLLLVCQPLLKKDPSSSSVLYTEALLPVGEDAASSFVERLFVDLAVMALLLGLVPRAFLSSFTSLSNIHELLINASVASENTQFHERIAWVDPISGDAQAQYCYPIRLNQKQLSSCLYDIYDRMFAHESSQNMFTKGFSLTALKEASRDHYNRATFAIFLRIVKSRVLVTAGTWDGVMDDLIDLVEIDRNRPLKVALNNLQDLCLQLHIFGMYTTAPLSPRWQFLSFVPRAVPTVFREWGNIPPTVCVVLEVPGSCLSPLRQRPEIGSPTLQIGLKSSAGHHNVFSCVQGIPGRLGSISAVREECKVEEDMRGWAGASSFVFSCWIPSWLLFLAPTTVDLEVRSSPFTATHLMDKTQPGMELFRASVTDSKHVRVLRERLGLESEVQRSSLTLPHLDQSATYSPQLPVEISVELASNKLPLTVTARLHVAAQHHRASLLAGCDVKITQSSPATMSISLANATFCVRFPYPVDGGKNRIRIARKSAYIEVSMASLFFSGGCV